MIFKAPHLLTKMEIWHPRYHDQYEDGKERVVLLAKYKVDAATPWIIVEFTKAKHLKGLRHCISRKNAQACSLDSNGKIPCYVIPMSKLENWDSVDEVKNTIKKLGWM